MINIRLYDQSGSDFQCAAPVMPACPCARVEVLFVASRFSRIRLIVFVLFLFAGLVSAQARESANERVVGGYFAECVVHYSGYTMADVEKTGVASQLTHLIYAFGNVTPGASPVCAIANPSAAWQHGSIFAINGKPFPGPVWAPRRSSLT
jgi:hypothetical protein